VAHDATKTMVKEAVEKVFNVTVLSVNVINAPAKRTRRSRSRRLTVRNSGFKKAIVTLPADARIPMFEGVE
jgi:large subunit ribosomal protein L23